MNQNQTKRAFWQQRFEAQRASGLGVTAWCQQEGITCSTYYYWRQRNMDKKSGPAFIKLLAPTAAIAEVTQPVAITLHTPGGYRIDLHTAAQAALLPAILAALS